LIFFDRVATFPNSTSVPKIIAFCFEQCGNFLRIVSKILVQFARRLQYRICGSISHNVPEALNMMYSKSAQIFFVSGAVLLSGLFSGTAKADVAACNAPAAVNVFHTTVSDALGLLPRLDANVDKCFNPGRQSYIQQTHLILQAVQTQMTQSLASVTSGYESGQEAQLASALTQSVQALSAAMKPVFDNAGNLTKYGFTTNDSMQGGQYKYPQCNSKTNDQPNQMWTHVYSDLQQLKQMSESLLQVASCLNK
jgi:hypothetical protein